MIFDDYINKERCRYVNAWTASVVSEYKKSIDQIMLPKLIEE